MKWTVIDIGHAEIKTAVCSVPNKPEKLVYNEGVSYSYMPCVAFVDNNDVYVGYQTHLLDAMGVDGIVTKWDESPCKEAIIRSLFSTIKTAAIKHYAESEIGAVLLFDDVSVKNNVEKAIENFKRYNKSPDSAIARIAMDTFSGVTCVCSSEAIASVYAPSREPTMIVDLGHSSLKVSIIAGGQQESFSINEGLRFSIVDLSDIVGYDFNLDVSEAEQILSGKYLNDVVKRNLIGGKSDYYLLPMFKKNKSEVQNVFEAKMERYLYGCFDFCSDSIKKSKWHGWDNIGSIVFCGGVANYNLLSNIFENYRKQNGISNEVLVKTFCKDAEWIGAFSAMQLPHERNSSTVIIKY